MTTQKPISKSPISDAFLSKNAEGDYLANSCFCERYVDNFSFHFTGKEKDPLRLYLQSGELCRARLTSPPDLFTGYSYLPHQARQAHHGARYLEHELMSMWLSVDPMADKYPSISPYAYCAWNLVKIVEPGGKDGEAIVDKNKNTIDITMRFYYNKNDENLQKFVFGMNPYEESQIEKDKENGFGSQKWSVVDYNDKVMSFSIGRKILPHVLQYGVNRIVKEANISTNNIVRLHVFGSLIRKPSVIQ